MASYKPISGDAVQKIASNVAASGYYLKGYVAGTTTALAMGIDSTPSSTLAKCQVNSDGYLINGSSAVFIPHFNADYKLVLYSNATDADADTFGNAVYTIDNISVSQSTDEWSLQSEAATYATSTTYTIASDVTANYSLGQRVKIDDNGTDKYGNITAFSYSSPDTTVTVLFDAGGSLSGSTINSVSLGFIDTVDSSLPRGFYPAESGETGITDYTWPRGYVQRYGAKGDGSTADDTAVANAMASLPAVAGTVYFPWTENGYVMADKITLSGTQDQLGFKGLDSRYVLIKFTSATSDGLYFAGEHDKFTSENIEYKSTNTSTGIGINCPNTGSATPLRDLIVKNFQVTGFKSGHKIAGGLNIAFKNGLFAGQGKTVSGGTNEFGSAAEAINHVTCDQVYYSSFETNIDNKNTSSLALNNCLSGFANKALVNPAGGIVYVNNMYWDSYNNTAFENAGYMPNPTYLKSSLGTQFYTNTAETRFYQGGHIRAFIRAYIATNNQASIPTGTPTKVKLDTKTYDSEGQFYTPSTDGLAAATIFEGGTGYSVSDVLTVAGGTSGTVTVATVSGGVVTGVTVSAAGSGYVDSQNVVTTGGSGDGLCTLDITALTKIYSATVNAGGSDYALDDTITVAGGTDGDLIVQTIDGSGAVTGVTLSGSVTSSGYATATGAATTTGGSGSGCTVDTVMEESYAFRALYPGTFRVRAQISWRVDTVDKTYKAMIYKNGSAVTTNHMSGAGAITQQQAQCVEDIVYLNVGDYIEIYVEHDEGKDSEIYFDDSYVVITDA